MKGLVSGPTRQKDVQVEVFQGFESLSGFLDASNAKVRVRIVVNSFQYSHLLDLAARRPETRSEPYQLIEASKGELIDEEESIQSLSADTSGHQEDCIVEKIGIDAGSSTPIVASTVT